MTAPAPARPALPLGRCLSVVVIDDHPIVVGGVRALFADHARISVVGSATTAGAGIELARRLRPDVVLLDVRLPDMPGPSAIRGLREAAPEAKIVLFTAYPDHAAIRVALDEDVDACLLKDGPPGEMVGTIRAVAAGRRVIDPRVAAGFAGAERPRRCDLTDREYEVLRLVAVGKSNPEIAADLGLTRNTIKTYLQTAMGKLGARNRVEAIVRAHEERLL